ncbi:MAG TPA: CHAT domain-containing protein [Chryseosolibacter sp.]|nr:CHAT domain-containing protein [Chryseosolibacter sp.]
MRLSVCCYLAIITMFSFESLGQTLSEFDKYFQQGVALYKEKRYPEAKTAFVDASEQSLKRHGIDSYEYRNTMWYLTYIYIALDDLKAAKDSYVQVMRKTDVSTNDNNGLIRLVEEMAGYLGKKDQKSEALALHKKAFRMYQVSSVVPVPGDLIWNVNNIATYSVALNKDSINYYYEAAFSMLPPSDNLFASNIREWVDYVFKTKATDYFDRLEKKCEEYIKAKQALIQPDAWYAEIWYQFGKIQKAKGQFERSLNAFLQAKDVLNKLPDASIHQKINVHYQALEFMNQTKKFDSSSDTWASDLRNLNDALLQTQPRIYCENLVPVFMYYFYRGQFEKAEAVMEKMLPIYANVVGKDHPDYKVMELSYRGVIEKTGHHEKLNALGEVKDLSKKETAAAFDLKMVSSEMDQMGRYTQRGDYLNALNIFEKRSKMFNDYFESIGDYDTYVLTLITAASLYREIGNLRLAEENFRKAESLALTKLKKGNFTAAKTLGAVGSFYQQTGALAEAEKKFLAAIDILNDTRTLIDSVENEKVYYETVSLLGGLYTEWGYHDDAENALLNVLRYYRRHHKEDSREVVLAKIDVADLYRVMEYFSWAEMLYQECDAPLKKILGEDNIRYITFLQSFAANHQLRGRYREAEPMYLKAKNFYLSNLGSKSSRYTGVVTDLAMMYYHQGEFQKAAAEYAILNGILLYKADNFFPALSEKEKTNFYRATAKSINTYNSFAVALSQTAPEKAGEIYDLQLLTKGMLFKSTDKVRVAVMNTADDSLKSMYQRWIEGKNSLAKVYQLSDAEKKAASIDEKKMEASLNNLEKGITSRSEMFTSLIVKRPTWQMVKNKLAPGEAAIEIVRIREAKPVYNFAYIGKGVIYDTLGTNGSMRVTELVSDRCIAHSAGVKEWDVIASINGIDTKGKTNDEISDLMATNPAKLTGKHKDGKEFSITIKSDSVFRREFQRRHIYAALIIRHDQPTVKAVMLPNGDALESRYMKYYSNMMHTRSTDKFSYQQFWEPIKAHLGNATKIYFSPDGVYNSINLNTLYNTATGKYLIDEVELVVVSNTSDVIFTKPTVSTNSAVLVGFPDYYLKNISTTNFSSPDTTYKFLSQDTTQRFMKGSSITDLPGTNVEVNKIESVLKSLDYQIHKYVSADASEQKLKSITSPRILHIATHGFFLGSVDDENGESRSITGVTDKKLRENPLLRSGLLLAGSGKTIAGQKTPNADDGILTAYEAMNLNLHETELVAMSACETGLGEMMSGEGVYGLQRAFRAAGAQSVLMSLWKVDDQSTQELMSTFYREWIGTAQRQKSFREAQMKVRSQFQHPYYWGAFVMIGL